MCDKDATLILKDNNASIWIGNKNAALDLNFLKKENISVIVNCTSHLPFIYELSDIPINLLETIRIPINDTSNEIDNCIMESKLKIMLPFIYKKFKVEHKNILIHCHAGISRSASVTAAVLFYIFKNDKNLKQNVSDKELLWNIINYIKKKRSCVFYYGTKFNFQKALYNTFNIK